MGGLLGEDAPLLALGHFAHAMLVTSLRLGNIIALLVLQHAIRGEPFPSRPTNLGERGERGELGADGAHEPVDDRTLLVEELAAKLSAALSLAADARDSGATRKGISDLKALLANTPTHGPGAKMCSYQSPPPTHPLRPSLY